MWRPASPPFSACWPSWRRCEQRTDKGPRPILRCVSTFLYAAPGGPAAPHGRCFDLGSSLLHKPDRARLVGRGREKGVRVEEPGFPKTAGSPGSGGDRRPGGVRRSVRGARGRERLRLFRPLRLRRPAPRLEDGDLLPGDDRRRGRRRRDQGRGDGRVLACEAAQGPSARRRFAGEARVQRFRPDHRRALGPRLLRRDRHDRDRRRGDDHRVAQRRRLRTRRRRLPRPRGRSGHDQGRSRAALPSRLDPRRQRRRRGARRFPTGSSS